MRNHENLKAFERADELALAVYRCTKGFPEEERFGLTAQIRKSAVSIPSNIVEGCARHTEADFLRFLDQAYGSAKELQYQCSLAARLGFFTNNDRQEVTDLAQQTARMLNGLIRSLRS